MLLHRDLDRGDLQIRIIALDADRLARDTAQRKQSRHQKEDDSRRFGHEMRSIYAHPGRNPTQWIIGSNRVRRERHILPSKTLAAWPGNSNSSSPILANYRRADHLAERPCRSFLHSW